ncbi:uncharacterized protein LOC115441313 isoform X1 [Manduca sexta]|uniref:uncharacterized protein LOC115441313 isoform X1 n=1 Tax=Manduca sexta TaxID=7130 RepID=UPI0011830353|nr:uncharacterized protein LOC115441313 isoform X1 [Manduca sexta]
MSIDIKMIPLELDGDNLGRKHQHYNRLLKEALTKKDIELTPNFKECGDIENLLKIDVACINKNVNFILEVLKCEDMLYVSRVVKRSTWLITEPEHAHIINMDYLKTHLFPYMTTRAINKLMLSIRLHIKDEKKAEEFYYYEEKKNGDKALKWLPYCSLPFIEQVVAKRKDPIEGVLLKRLCEKSISVLEISINNCHYYYNYENTLKATLFLIHNNAERYLDAVEKLESYQIPAFGRKYTEVLMKVCPQRILNNFEKLSPRIDYATCAKYMKKEDIKPFLLQQAGNQKMNKFLKYYVKYFLQHLPKEDRCEFTRQLMFINHEKSLLPGKIERDHMPESETNRAWTNPKNVYDWYQCVPFDVTFHDLKKLLQTESSPGERNSMLTILLYCAGNDIKNIHTLLQYYNEKHINELFQYKINFIKNVLKYVDVINDNETWSILNRLFHSMDVYIESSNNVQVCVEIILIYNALHDIPNPKVVENKFLFSTLKVYENRLIPVEKEKVFKYLYNHLLEKTNKITITSESCFNELVTLIRKYLELLNDWEKKLNDYPLIINKIKELIAIKREKSWNSDLSLLYHVNKTWRKYLFEESVLLSPTESVCINALKHDPRLLSCYEDRIDKLHSSVSSSTFLNKIRVYWPISLTTEWKKFYLRQLDNPSKQKIAIKSLMRILPQDELKALIIKYAPEDTKINWGAIDEVHINLKKYVAMNMYVSRPLLSAEMVLLYAKGDYLQYCIPSLNSILSNLSNHQSASIIQKLLTAHVTLRKYGIRLAFSKLESKNLIPLFSEAWKATNKSSIRVFLLQKIYDALCNETNIDMSEELWELLSYFIDNLSSKDYKKIYDLLKEVSKVPYTVRGKFFMKSYAFFKSMPADDLIGYKMKHLIDFVPDVVNQLDTEMIVNVMWKDAQETFDKKICEILDVFTTNALFCEDEETQIRNYRKILAPLMDRHLPKWDIKHDNQKYVPYNMVNLLHSFMSKLKNVFLDPNLVIPVKMFKDILSKIENSLIAEENYVFITTWKLLTSFTELVNTHRPSIGYVEMEQTDEVLDTRVGYKRYKYLDEKWDELFAKIIPTFAKVCSDNLQIDIEKYFPSIYTLFGQAVTTVIYKFDPDYANYMFYKHMLTINKSKENYLMVLEYSTVYAPEGKEEILDEIRSLLESHPSLEVKLHYAEEFNILDITTLSQYTY